MSAKETSGEKTQRENCVDGGEGVTTFVTFLAYCLDRATDVPSAKGQGTYLTSD